jgi:tetratricopeptide (TPR) repeat protein
MKIESVLFAISGMVFGVIVGWIIGSQQQSAPPVRAAAVQEAPAQAGGQEQAPPQQPAVLDEARVQLANTYFDGERYQDAIKWYEDALKIDPKNVNASTDLGVSYYYLNQPDRALKQFDHSLAIDPRHTKTLLNQGIVRAFGKQDLEGATSSWKRVVELAPDSPEGQAARRALDSMRNAHPGGGGTSPSGP